LEKHIAAAQPPDTAEDLGHMNNEQRSSTPSKQTLRNRLAEQRNTSKRTSTGGDEGLRTCQKKKKKEIKGTQQGEN